MFSENSEANASELRENLEEMFPQYYLHSDKSLAVSNYNHAMVYVSPVARGLILMCYKTI